MVPRRTDTTVGDRAAILLTLGLSLTYMGATSSLASQTTSSARPSPIWSIAARGWGRPVARGSSIYFLTDTHEIVAVNAGDGGLKWRHQFDDVREAPLGGTLVIAGDRVVVGDYDITAVDADTGKVVWRFAPSRGYGAGIYLGDEGAGGVLFAGSPAGILFAIDAMSGAERWMVNLGASAPTTVYSPVSRDGVVFAGFTEFRNPPTGGVIAIEERSGRIRWRHEFPDSTGSTRGLAWAGGPVLAGDLVLAARADGSICAFRPEDGAVTVVVDESMVTHLDHRPLAPLRSGLIAGSMNGDVSRYELPSGRLVWKTRLTLGSTAFKITVDNGIAYVPFMNGQIAALDADDGRELWKSEPDDGAFLWPPLALGHRLYIAGLQALVALKL